MKRVIIVGRPNVGKSTLFNRLATSVKSLTLDYLGVTRDFLRDTVEWKDHWFDLVDSGGMIVAKPPDELEQKIQLVIRELIGRADLLLFVVDGRHEITADDWAIARELHKVGKPVITVVNKVDTPKLDTEIGEFNLIGFPVVGVSAEHGRHFHVLLDAVTERLPHTPTVAEQPESLVKVMLLGKPNVGKSSLMNTLLSQERAIVSDVPGTTRQALSESVMYYRESIELTDAPGVRRKRAVEEPLEMLMVKRAFDALKKANMVLLLIDGSQKVVVDQEIKLAFYAFGEQYKSLILVVNKSDLMTKDDRDQIRQQLTKYRHLVKKIPLIFISCKTGEHVGKLMALVKKVSERAQQQLDEALLAVCVEEFNKRPLYVQGERLLLGWARQVGTHPPTILLGVSDPRKFQPSTFSFIDSLLRKRFDLLGVPVKFLVRRAKIVRISEDDGRE